MRKQCQRANCANREPVKLFHRAKTTKPFCRADEAIFMVPRRHRETNDWYQHPRIKQMGFDHVGHHHQPDLPPIVQEIPCRSAEAERTGSPVGLRGEANRTPCSDGCWSLPPGRRPRAPQCAGWQAVPYSPSQARPRPRAIGGFQGQGRAGQVPPKACKPKSNAATRFGSSLTLAPKFWPRVGSRTDQHLLKYISFLRGVG